jgi:LuxR family maltose regulon positive regulatory protein
MRLLDRLLQAAEGGNRMGSVIEILVLHALAHQAIAPKERGDITPALAPLKRALTLAEPGGYIRIFVDEGEPMRLLILDFAQSSGLGRLRIEKQKRDQDHKLIGYTGKLLAAFAQPAAMPQSETLAPALRSGASAGVRNQKSKMVEPLSERELQVLRLLRTDLNGPEIARELIVSLSTLRTHTQSIYAKLGVNNRRAAVRRAEELDLL